MNKHIFEYNGLNGFIFIDENGNEMPAADAPHVVQKAQSFGGDRSAAGRYAAQVRWGKKSPEFDPSTVRVLSATSNDKVLDAMYPEEGKGDLTDGEWTEVKAYQSSGSTLNTDLREGKTKVAAEVLDKAFAHATPLPQDMVFHRGVQASSMKDDSALAERFRSIKVGESFVDLGYTSTSSSRDFAREWTARTGIRFEIVVKKGTRVMPMNPVLRRWSSYPTEKEVLLPRGAKFTVWDIQYEANHFRGDSPQTKRPERTMVIKMVME